MKQPLHDSTLPGGQNDLSSPLSRVGLRLGHCGTWLVRVLVATVMCGAFGALLMSQSTPSAFAAPAKAHTFAVQTQAHTNWSFYVSTSSTTTAYNEGCNEGKAGATYKDNTLIVLDFGGQLSNGSGTELINGTILSNSQIEAYGEQYAKGYYICTGSDTTTKLTLGLGTNNSIAVSGTLGKDWVNVVKAAENWVKTSGYNSQATIVGADDIEPSFGSASAAIAWANGFNDGSGTAYYDYGSADGCPTNSSNNSIGCNNGWTQYDVYYVSWGALPAHPLPEIYVQAQANQWAMISLYGANYQGGRIDIAGPLDEHDLDSSTFTAAQAWTALWNAVNANSKTAQNFGYSCEIHNG